MKSATVLFAAAIFASTSTYATGLATCDSGPESGWQPQEKLSKMLIDKGERREAYFHPVTLAPVPTRPR